ncbi:MAG: shikimate kinase [Oscillospiraceae bacterium]|nr:shikimate kinase [Oscillospiraceae bacterium]
MYALIGRKLGHSFSKPIHNALGNADYSLLELEPEELHRFMLSREFDGLNVTIPYKLDVIPYLDEISDGAREIGSVNTIVNRGGRLYGYNTDIDGFIYTVKSAGIAIRGKKVLVLGSGGTSRTARAAAKQLGAREIIMISRSGEDNYENISRHFDADVIVNTTPVGMYPNCPGAALSLDGFTRLSGVVDVVYNPARTGILLDAEARGIKCAGGLRMLVGQAKRAEELFFDRAIADSEIERIASEMRRETENIVLIGMPAVGKSTVGRCLSALSGREVLDTDKLIVEKAGMTIPEIFERYGEARFREIETEVLSEVGRLSGKIITCGGGAVTQTRNYPLLHQNGVIIELMRPVDSLSMKGRPLSKSADALREMFRTRRPMYDSFRDAVFYNMVSSEETAKKIWRYFNENPRN